MELVSKYDYKMGKRFSLRQCLVPASEAHRGILWVSQNLKEQAWPDRHQQCVQDVLLVTNITAIWFPE
jgi:hypothetical protein